MSLPHPQLSAPWPSHPLVGDQLGEMELVPRDQIHPAIAKLAAGTPLAPADQDALYRLLAHDSILRECLLSLEHHLAAAGDQLGRLPPSPYRRALADVLNAIRRSAR